MKKRFVLDVNNFNNTIIRLNLSVQHSNDKIKSNENNSKYLQLFDCVQFVRLSDEIDELKNLPVRDVDEEIFELREQYGRLNDEWKTLKSENDNLQHEIHNQQSIIQKYEFDVQKQVETTAHLNDEV